MTIDNRLTKRIQDLREQVLDTAADCLRASDERRYRGLSDVALRLTALIPQGDTVASRTAVSEGTSASHAVPLLDKSEDIRSGSEETSQTMPANNTTPIFARRGRVTYEAELDPSRISGGGRGPCVQYEGQWMTTSKAAGRITGTAVNGWQNFWKYTRDDQSEGPIQELRDRQLRSAEENIPW